jgi:hypothetical protein
MIRKRKAHQPQNRLALSHHCLRRKPPSGAEQQKSLPAQGGKTLLKVTDPMEVGHTGDNHC